MLIRRNSQIITKSFSRPFCTQGLSITKLVRAQIANGSIYRAIGILAGIQIGLTLSSSYLIDKGVIMGVDDYYANSTLKENQQYQVAGIIKPGSISIKRGTVDVKFILTNFDDDIIVMYRGETKFEFKEGETIVLTAYTPDINQKKKIIGINYLTKHSMDGNMWQDNVGVERNTYGVNSRITAQL